jgi:3-isopropylmalate/(R)-2-methylmalate dehydratase small subunit
MKVEGEAIKFGDNVDTDVILPGKYLTLIEPTELAKHALEGLDSSFPEKAKRGIIVIGGKNFGCGSSREQAPLALKYAGVQCVVAESFARIFFRNAINIGLPAVECKGISTFTSDNDDLVVDFDLSDVKNLTTRESIHANKLPQFILEILTDGGLIENLRKRLKKK